MKKLCISGLFLLALPYTCQMNAQEIPPAAQAVRTEALKPNIGPEGRPLPLAAHWHSNATSFPLAFQIEMIRRGHHILPFSYLVGPGQGNDEERLKKRFDPAFEDSFRLLAAWKMPFVLITGGQWEAEFYSDKHFLELPPDQNPCVIDTETGEIKKMVSPFGPVEQWRELGKQWGSTRYLRWLAELYPDPPMVIFVSNNEAQCMRWHQLESEKRYMEKYGPGKSDDFKRKLLEDLWFERYQALFAGIRESLPNENWKRHVILAGYNAGPGPNHLGRGPDLEKYLTVVQEDHPYRTPWEGTLPEAYDNAWQVDKFDHHVWSCQVEAMNIVFQRKHALQVNPDYWMESIFWDGGSEKAKAYEDKEMLNTPERYAAWAQFVLWTLTPRVARQWNGSSDPRANWLPQFAALMRVVDRIYADPVLSRFWRKSELVVNPDGEHPFNYEFPAKWKNEDRWFRLTTDLDPPRPWTLATRLPVFALARIIGEKPSREWLLYAHAPLGDLNGVKVVIPGYQTVTVDVPLAGVFYHVKEIDGAITQVGLPDQVKYVTNQAPEARPDNYAVAGGTTLNVTPFQFSGGSTLLRNDTDYEGDALTAVIDQSPRHGKLSLKSDGSFSYRPDPGYEGTDHFTYRTTDGHDRSEPAIVTVRVIGKPVAVVDDSFASFTGTAYPERSEKLGYQGDITYFSANPDPGEGSLASWTFTGLEPDQYEIFATWPEFSYHRPKKIPFEIIDGSTFKSLVMVSQETAPTGPEIEGVKWQNLGTFDVKSGTLRVEMTNTANGRWVVADAVRIVGQRTGKSQIIDDGDPNFSAMASWNVKNEGFSGTSRWTMSRSIPKASPSKKPPAIDYDTADWTLDGLQPGSYELYVTWPADTDSGKCSYDIYENGKRLLRTETDQRTAPDELYFSGTWWQHLGNIQTTGNSIQVRMNAGSGKGKYRMTADAVALFKTENPPTP